MSENTDGFGKWKRQKERQETINRTSQLNNVENNPCLKEQEMSYKCLSDNNYDGNKCTSEFLNYKECKLFWNNVRHTRRSKGLVPYLPKPEDREKIKEEYFSSIKK